MDRWPAQRVWHPEARPASIDESPLFPPTVMANFDMDAGLGLSHALGVHSQDYIEMIDTDSAIVAATS